MTSNSNWTELYFTDRSPPGCLAPAGDLTLRGLCLVLIDLSLEGNFGPICKKELTLYSNSDKALGGRYYVLSESDERLLLQAASQGLLDVRPKGELGAYVDFTDTGLHETLKQPLHSRLGAILGTTQETLLRTASQNVDAVCELVNGFEADLIKARSFNASYFTFHNVVSILHKLMLDPHTAMEHLNRQYKRKIRQKPIENNSSLFDLYVGPNAHVLNSFEQGMFMSLSGPDDGSGYRLGKWHGGYNHLGDFNPLHYGRRSLAKDVPDYVPSSSCSIDRVDCAVGSVQRAPNRSEWAARRHVSGPNPVPVPVWSLEHEVRT